MAKRERQAALWRVFYRSSESSTPAHSLRSRIRLGFGGNTIFGWYSDSALAAHAWNCHDCEQPGNLGPRSSGLAVASREYVTCANCEDEDIGRLAGVSAAPGEG